MWGFASIFSRLKQKRMIDRERFFNAIKAIFFNGKLSQPQVDGINIILNEWEEKKYTDLRWLSYMLATVYHETSKTMQPIEEYGRGKGHSYGVPDPVTKQSYYGRGFVQLTWAGNYKTMGKLLNLPLYEFPHLALDPKIATEILFEGMLRANSKRGDFTGKSLEDYFNPSKEDWVNARRIINGLDRAELIAGYGKKFLLALEK